MGYLLRNNMSFRQEMADFAQPLHVAFHAVTNTCQSQLTAASKPSSRADDSLNCYPSPDRFAHLWRLPVTPFLVSAKNGIRAFVCVAFSNDIIDSGIIGKHNKGFVQCLNHLLSLRLPRSLAFRLALKPTASAHLSALASAALLAKRLATTTVCKARLLADLSAHFPTTSKVTRLNYSTKINETAAAGQSCVRRFCF